MKYTSVSPRISRKGPRGYKRSFEAEETEPSEHSSDSGLGLDHQTEVQVATRGTGKRPIAYTFEEETNTEFCFPSMPGRGRGPAIVPANLSAPLSATSKDGRAVLAIVSQPEQQHRARYQTEGSRGAVKDRTGNGFPIVKLSGYNKATTLQIFVGTDVGRVAPHMFYQACRVSGKNSTPCFERKVDGTVVIEVDLDPSKDMIVTCDCVGILKERNVDVEHRFPDQTAARNKKKSTRCRMVFRAAVVNCDGSTEVLQVCSQPIVCRAETWTLRQKERKYLEAFEMWCWRRMEKVKWIDKVRNEDILKKVGEERTIIRTIRHSKANWIGHILRRNCLLQETIEGRIMETSANENPSRRLGRRRIQILDDLKKKGDDYGNLKDAAEDRKIWRETFSLQ